MIDEIDSQRALSPLSPTSDAKTIDTEGLSAEQVAASIIAPIDKNKTQDRS